MYDRPDDRKLKFKYSYGSDETYDAIDKAFNSISPYELEWGMDVCLQDDESEVQRLVDSLSQSRQKDNTSLIILRDYCKWCMLEGYKNVSYNLIRLKPPAVERIKTLTVPNPQQLQIHLDSFLDPENKHTMHMVYRAYYWLAFSGVMEEYAMKICQANVDLENKLISYEDYVWPICEDGFNSIKFCTESNTINVYRGRYTENGTVLFRTHDVDDKTGTEFILRGIESTTDRNNYYLDKNFSSKQGKAIREGKTSYKLSYSRVWNSGIYYRAYLKEVAGVKPDFTVAAKQTFSRTVREVKRFKPGGATHERLSIIKKQIERDYIRWKLAHNL